MIKKLILVLFLFMLVGVFAEGVTSENCVFWINERGSWKEMLCDICGKQVYEWVKNDYAGYNDNMLGNYSYNGFEGEKLREINWNVNLDVCEECYKKYNQKLREYLFGCFNKWNEKIVRENYKLRKVHTLQIEENNKLKMKKQIEELKKELDKLQKEDK